MQRPEQRVHALLYLPDAHAVHRLRRSLAIHRSRTQWVALGAHDSYMRA